MNSLINASEGYIPNLGPVGPLLHVEKFVVGGGLVVCKPILVIDLGSCPSSGRSIQKKKRKSGNGGWVSTLFSKGEGLNSTPH